MLKYLTKFFKKDKEVEKPDYEERISDLEDLVTLQAQIISNIIDKLDEVKKFREIYVEDMRVFANAIANIDKRTHQLEELVQHINFEIAEIEENIDENEDDDVISTKIKSDLN